MAFALASIGCGGRVVVDGGRGGHVAGAGGGSPSGGGGAPAGTGGGLPDCATFGYVAEGAPCKGGGAACVMAGACDGVRIVCVGSRWRATTPPSPLGACGGCGAHLFCTTSALCIEDDVAEETAFTRCAPDPCPSGAGQLACACAFSLCPPEEPTCQTVDNAAGRTLFCERPN
jgi:hypothetical protein